MNSNKKKISTETTTTYKTRYLKLEKRISETETLLKKLIGEIDDVSNLTKRCINQMTQLLKDTKHASHWVKFTPQCLILFTAVIILILTALFCY